MGLGFGVKDLVLRVLAVITIRVRGLGLGLSVKGVLSVQVTKWYDLLRPQSVPEPRFTLSRQQDMAGRQSMLKLT